MNTLTLDEAWECIAEMAERWTDTPDWHEPPFYDGEIHVSTRELHAAALVTAERDRLAGELETTKRERDDTQTLAGIANQGAQQSSNAAMFLQGELDAARAELETAKATIAIDSRLMAIRENEIVQLMRDLHEERSRANDYLEDIRRCDRARNAHGQPTPATPPGDVCVYCVGRGWSVAPDEGKAECQWCNGTGRQAPKEKP